MYFKFPLHTAGSYVYFSETKKEMLMSCQEDKPPGASLHANGMPNLYTGSL